MEIDGTATQWQLRNQAGNDVSAKVYTEQDGVFTFHRAGRYFLELRNPRLRNRIGGEEADTVSFTWRIKVEGDVPEVVRYMVALNGSPEAGGVLSGGGTYEEDSEVTVTAVPQAGYYFVNWTDASGRMVAETASHTFTITSDVVLTAHFEAYPVTVRVSSNNAAWGRVSITGDGTYEKGSEVTITAVPAAGYRFVNWTDAEGAVFSTEAEHTFAVMEDLDLTAHFEARPVGVETFTVRVSSNNAAWGRVSLTGDGTYEKGAEVTITAVPAEGYRFVNWTDASGAVFSTEAVHTFMVTENMELTANFEEKVANEALETTRYYVYARDRVIYLSEDMGQVQVYDIAGICVFKGETKAIPVSRGGVYIVATSVGRFKVLVK